MSRRPEAPDTFDRPAGDPVRQLLYRILLKSRVLTGAEAGSIYLLGGRGANRKLCVASTQNDRLQPHRPAAPLPLESPAIAAYVARTGRTVLLDDAARIPLGRPYRAVPDGSGYAARSVLCFPLRNRRREVIGVVELLNRRQAGVSDPVPFARGQSRPLTMAVQILGSEIGESPALQHAADRDRRRGPRPADHRDRRTGGPQTQTDEAFELSVGLLARAAEIHDQDTGKHVLRVNEYSLHLARLCDMPAAFCTEIAYSAQMHDVGKLSIAAAILKKREILTDEERREMMNHPVYGHRILEPSQRLRMAAEIALHHHEKWDGSGYPGGLAGEAIPLSARIVAIADVYDALRAARPYKRAYSHREAMRVLLQGDERIDPPRHFDPRLLALLGEHHSAMADIWQRLAG